MIRSWLQVITWTVLVCAGSASGDTPQAAQPRGMVPDTTTGAQSREPRRFALCIGINAYDGGSGYRSLNYAVADASKLGMRLASLGYQVRVMTDEAGESLKPTYLNLLRELESFTRQAENPNDTVIISYSGHGNSFGQPFLVPVDYQPGKAVPMDLLLIWLRSDHCPARKKLLILDACRSATTSFSPQLGTQDNLLVLSACGANEESLEESRFGHGRFTWALLQGLDETGGAFPADRNVLLADELSAYLHRRFRQEGWTRQQSPEMFGRIRAAIPFDVATRPPSARPLAPEQFQLHLTRAADFYTHQQLAEALEAATIAVQIQPASADARAMRALVYLEMGYSKEAERDVRETHNAEHALSNYVAGLLKRLDGHAGKALEKLTESAKATAADPGRWPLLAKGPLAVTLHGAIGDCQLTLGRLDEAVQAYSAALKAAGDEYWSTPALLINRGCARERQAEGRPELNELAAADFTRAIELSRSPEEIVRALINRGVTLGKLRKKTAELADYDAAAALPAEKVSPGLRAEALFYAGLTRADIGKTADAIACFDHALATSGAPAELMQRVLINRGLAHGKLGNTQQEMADYSRIIAVPAADPRWKATALSNRAYLHVLTGEFDKAVADCTVAINLDGADPAHRHSALVNRALAYLKLRKYDQALADATSVIDAKDVEPKIRAEARVYRGCAREAQGRNDLAVDDYSAALQVEELDDDPRAIAEAGRQRLQKAGGR